MSRLFWMGLGVTIGVLATRRVNRAARHLTPQGFADDVGDALRELAGAVGSFGADVRAGMAEREHELHRMVDERTGIETDGRPAGGDHRYEDGGRYADAPQDDGRARYGAGRANGTARARRAAN
ncbi:MAG TPA: hypothetical protein VGD67_08855 [Pseudonocardiaceae bacterium]